MEENKKDKKILKPFKKIKLKKVDLEPPPSKEVMHDYLQTMYNNVESAGSFQGVNKLYDSVQNDGVYKINVAQIENFLETSKTYTMNKPSKKVRKRVRVMVAGLDDQFDVDLASMDKYIYVRANDEYKFLLVVIDIFSRYLWVRPLKDKTALNVIAAFDDIFRKSGRLPRRIRSDRGSEFTAAETQNYFRRKGINQIFTANEMQANYAERVIKTLKSKINKYMVNVNSKRYIDVLQDLVKAYNNTWHYGIKLEPKNVTRENERRLWWQMYWPGETFNEEKLRLNKKRNLFKFEIGDFVRLSLRKQKFQREYNEKWTGEVFIVAKRFLREGSIDVYRVTDYEGEEVKGSFYRNELQRTKQRPDTLFIVDEILGERENGEEIKVSYQSWPKKFDRWIEKDTLQKEFM